MEKNKKKRIRTKENPTDIFSQLESISCNIFVVILTDIRRHEILSGHDKFIDRGKNYG
jgi:hypothetical protein